jgi:hypothetical protein
MLEVRADARGWIRPDAWQALSRLGLADWDRAPDGVLRTITLRVAFHVAAQSDG